MPEPDKEVAGRGAAAQTANRGLQGLALPDAVGIASSIHTERHAQTAAAAQVTRLAETYFLPVLNQLRIFASRLFMNGTLLLCRWRCSRADPTMMEVDGPAGVDALIM